MTNYKRITDKLIEKADRETLFSIGCDLSLKLEIMRDQSRNIEDTMESSKYAIIDLKLNRVMALTGMNIYDFSF